MVCSDVTDPMTFLRLYKLMQSMDEKEVAAKSLYGIPENKEHVRPLRIMKPDEMEGRESYTDDYQPKQRQQSHEGLNSKESRQTEKKDEL